MKYFYFIAEFEVCGPTLLMSIDEKIDSQKICSKSGTKNEDQALCNVVHCTPASLARDVLNIFYLKPDQFNLLFNGPMKLLIEGPAGTGKTIIIILKILYLVNSETKYDIILFAPFPHHLRCKQLLEKNGVQVHIVETLNVTYNLELFQSPKRQSKFRPVVRIVDLFKFGRGLWEGKNISHQHVFVDDLQTTQGNLSWKELLSALIQTCDVQDERVYTWIAFDPVQQRDKYSIMRDELRRVFKELPTYELNHVLRNTQPILDVVHAEYSTGVVKILKNGHTINGPPVDIHVAISKSLHVTEWPRCRKDHDRNFLKATFENIFKEWHGVPTAVVYGSPDDGCLCTDVLVALGKKVIDTTTYIEHDIELKHSQVVCGLKEYLSSFEMPLVIVVGYESAECNVPYILASRARTKLVLIPLPSRTSTADIEYWKKSYPDARLIITDLSLYQPTDYNAQNKIFPTLMPLVNY